MQPTPPRQFTPTPFLPGGGMPGDRDARLAARRAFVDLKRTFLHALEDLHNAEWLRAQVRSAEDPSDLWLLRAPLFAVLNGADPDRRQRRQMVRRGLDSLFPDLEPPSAFSPF
jgi:hypothetical protein